MLVRMQECFIVSEMALNYLDVLCWKSQREGSSCFIMNFPIFATNVRLEMRELPENKLDPRIKNVWRINDFIWLTLIFVICFLPFVIAANFEDWAFIVSAVIAVVYVALLIVFLLVLPPIRYVRWRYAMNNDFLDIAKGIIWKKRYIIPFIRVQNTDTRQGPILRAFKLASVTVSTAAGSHEIPGLDMAEAENVRDRAAEFARLAREDV